MTHALEQEYNIKRNHKKIYRLMKENNLLAVIKAKKTFVNPGEPNPKHNVLKRNFNTSCPFDKVATDMTEIKHKGRKIYISPVKDLNTHVIEANVVANNASISIVVEMIEQIKDKSLPEGTIFHSDQGSVYNNLQFQKILEDNILSKVCLEKAHL